MEIGIIGAGYVGLVTAACFAKLGHRLTCVDQDQEKIEKLNKGILPLYEPGLKELIEENRAKFLFTTRIEEAVENSEIIFIAVGTPPREDGEADLSGVEAVAGKIAETMKSYRLIVEKSTVPVQTGEWVKKTMQWRNKNNVEFDVASNPEFLREGSAIQDFMHPDRIVLGVETKRAEKLLLELYKDLHAPMVITDIQSAEIIKHASNSFLAMKISFINAIANICERTGADVVKVAEGMGMDRRIGRAFLDAGVGFGGFCFPKDLAAFIRIAEKVGYDFQLLKEVEKINLGQRKLLVKKIKDSLWTLKDKTIGILGLAFKPNTDDLRYAPSLDIIFILQKEGAKIKVYDPVAMDNARKVFNNVTFCRNPYEVAENSEALVILTEWEEFKNLDLRKIKGLLKNPILIDGRNIYDPQSLKELGFTYRGVGR